LGLNLARGRKVVVDAPSRYKKQNPYTNRVYKDKVVYFGWLAPIIEEPSRLASEEPLKKNNIAIGSWDSYRRRFSPVILTRAEYYRLRTKLRGCFVWGLSPIASRGAHES